MSRQFLANLSFLVILNILIKPIYILGIEVAVQNRLGATTYGLYFAILNAGYLLQILNDFGLQIYNNRAVALDRAHIASAFRRILGLKGALSLGFLLAFTALIYGLGYGDFLAMALPVGVNLVLVSLVLFLRSNVSGLGYYKWDSILSIMDKGLLILFCGYLLWLHNQPFTIMSFIYAQMASLALTALTAGVMIRVKSDRSSSGSKIELSRLLKDSLPFALAVFFMTVYTRVDAVMIEQLASDGQYQSGLYAAGYRLLDAANMFAFLFAVLLLPMFTRLLGQKDETMVLLHQAMRMMWVLTIIAVLTCYGFRSEIIGLLYTESTTEWSETFGVLFFSYISIGLMYVYGTYMTARGEMRTLNILYASSAVANIVLNYILIPHSGAMGAAISTLITQSLVTLVLIALTHNRLGIEVIKTWFRPMGFIAIAGAALWLFKRSSLADIPWGAAASLYVLLLVGFAIRLRLIRRTDASAIIAGRGS